jgi:hypothetical protein
VLSLLQVSLHHSASRTSAVRCHLTKRGVSVNSLQVNVKQHFTSKLWSSACVLYFWICVSLLSLPCIRFSFCGVNRIYFNVWGLRNSAVPLRRINSFFLLSNNSDSKILHYMVLWVLGRVDKKVSKLRYALIYETADRLCGLMVRVPGYRWQRSWFDSRRHHIFWAIVGLFSKRKHLYMIVRKV